MENKQFKKGINEKKFIVTGSFLKSAYTSACKDWRDKIAEEIPEAFDFHWPEIKKGKWYWTEGTDQVFYVIDPEVDNKGRVKYAAGINNKNRWVEKDNFFKLPSDGRWLHEVAQYDSRPGIAKRLKQTAEDYLGYTYDNTVHPHQDRVGGVNRENWNNEWTFINGILYTAPLLAGGIQIMTKGKWVKQRELKKISREAFEKVFGNDAILED